MSKSKHTGIVSIIIGTVIGAGFASGQEIMTFFIRYGRSGLYGLAASGVLWILMLSTLLFVLRKDRIHSYSQLADNLFGHEISLCYQILVAVFMFLCLSVMLSGAGALFYEQWQLPHRAGVFLMAAATYLTMIFGQKGLSLVNRLLVPLLIAGILIASLTSIANPLAHSSVLCLEPIATLSLSDSPLAMALLSALQYVSYNMISVVVILSGIPLPIPRRTALLAGSILAVLSLALGVATFINYGTIKAIEVPVPALLAGYTKLQCFYTIILLLAMYTTAIANCYGCLEHAERVCTLSKPILLLLLMAVALIASRLGFTLLISRGYAFFGYVGLLQLLLLIRRAVQLKKRYD